MKIYFPTEKALGTEQEKKIAVLDADEKECQELCDLIKQQNYNAIPLYSLAKVEQCIRERDCIAVILDLDSVPVDNRMIRELTIRNPEVYFLATSKDRFHPDLKDAISYHIYACLNKPVDSDELFFWLRSIYQEKVGS